MKMREVVIVLDGRERKCTEFYNCVCLKDQRVLKSSYKRNSFSV